jgi:carbon-monoxide dehydrogenase small subunit
MSEITLSFTVNGRAVTLATPPMRRLLDLLREDLKLTGSKEGCGEGECGACSVILNGTLVNSCIVPAIQVQGAVITTVEEVQSSPLGAAVQEAFCEHGGSQCGICTPGMIVTAYWLSMNRGRWPAGERSAAGGGSAAASAGPPPVTLRDLMAGNLCRCTGYDLILASVEAALQSPPAAVPETVGGES